MFASGLLREVGRNKSEQNDKNLYSDAYKSYTN